MQGSIRKYRNAPKGHEKQNANAIPPAEFLRTTSDYERLLGITDFVSAA
jgi:hypothetical protein